MNQQLTRKEISSAIETIQASVLHTAKDVSKEVRDTHSEKISRYMKELDIQTDESAKKVERLEEMALWHDLRNDKPVTNKDSEKDFEKYGSDRIYTTNESTTASNSLDSRLVHVDSMPNESNSSSNTSSLDSHQRDTEATQQLSDTTPNKVPVKVSKLNLNLLKESQTMPTVQNSMYVSASAQNFNIKPKMASNMAATMLNNNLQRSSTNASIAPHHVTQLGQQSSASRLQMRTASPNRQLTRSLHSTHSVGRTKPATGSADQVGISLSAVKGHSRYAHLKEAANMLHKSGVNRPPVGGQMTQPASFIGPSASVSPLRGPGGTLRGPDGRPVSPMAGGSSNMYCHTPNRYRPMVSRETSPMQPPTNYSYHYNPSPISPTRSPTRAHTPLLPRPEYLKQSNSTANLNYYSQPRPVHSRHMSPMLTLHPRPYQSPLPMTDTRATLGGTQGGAQKGGSPLGGGSSPMGRSLPPGSRLMATRTNAPNM
eukprot:Platyproteum_vivax@DN7008_c2_g1_i1.p1